MCLYLLTDGPGATGRSYSDFSTIIESIRDRLFPGDTVVHTGHGESTTIGAEGPHSTSGSPAGTDDRARHSCGPGGGRRRKCHPAGNVNQSSTNTKPVATAISTAQVVS